MAREIQFGICPVRGLGRFHDLERTCEMKRFLRTQQTLPYHQARDYPKANTVRHPPKNSLGSEKEEVEYLQERRRVEAVDADEWGRGTGNEDACLIEEAIGGVEGAVPFEWGRGEGEEQHWVETEIDGVFGNVDEEEGEHATGGVMLVKIWGIMMLRLEVLWNERGGEKVELRKT